MLVKRANPLYAKTPTPAAPPADDKPWFSPLKIFNVAILYTRKHSITFAKKIFYLQNVGTTCVEKTPRNSLHTFVSEINTSSAFDWSSVESVYSWCEKSSSSASPVKFRTSELARFDVKVRLFESEISSSRNSVVWILKSNESSVGWITSADRT